MASGSKSNYARCIRKSLCTITTPNVKQGSPVKSAQSRSDVAGKPRRKSEQRMQSRKRRKIAVSRKRNLTLKANDKGFTEIPALAALRDESKKEANFTNAQVMPSNATLRIGSGTGDEEMKDQMDSVDEEDEDAKLARLLQEEEYWKSKKQRKNPRSSSSSNKFYIKINEEEIANDYPLPAY
ncbi:cytosine-specific methyltransferase, putative [Medicago truncatula]|uniref:Cytosine-specific methyltransferase, putative n=1 Tax=Medicago truncatula TaxID=3880 RepID=A0A072UVR0_MEDTR|nr:cytosine-specific methyltransferase, putative [Medicago truncatula]